MSQKPRASIANAQAYERISKLPEGAAIDLAGHSGRFVGMTGRLLTLEFKSLRPRIRYFRIGMPEIEQIKVSSHD